MAPLDNAVWHALAGPQAAFAERQGSAVRFRPDVSPFLALPDEPDDASWHDLARLLGPAGIGALFRRHTPDLPSGWTELERFEGVQFVATDPTVVRAHVPRAPNGVDLVTLGPDDVADMLDLWRAPRPAPSRHAPTSWVATSASASTATWWPWPASACTWPAAPR
jgi:hypothetical protein